MPVWILALVLGTVSTANSTAQLYPHAADRAAMAKTIDSPAGLAMTGPAHFLTDYDYGAMLSHRMIGFMAVLVGLMSVQLVVRHTRAEEEANRAELVRSTVVGRHATLAAALLLAVLANLVLGLLLALGLGGLGLAGITWGGSLVYGAAHAATGLAFAGVAAVTVQITGHARAAAGMALAVVGAAYVLRAAGDVGSGALSWASPIGWAQRSYPYVDDRWWPLLLGVLLGAVTAAAGFVLSTRRDVGAGLRAQRPGPAAASPFLGSPLGLALRLQRGLLTGFGIAVFVLGGMYGSILGQVKDMLENVDAVRKALAQAGGSVEESFAATVMTVIAVVAAVYVVIAAVRLRGEETAGRAEPLLSTGLSRTRWVLGHVLVAAVGGTVLLALAGLGFGIAGAASAGRGGLVLSLTGAALAYAPALWVTAGVAVLLFGWLPGAVQAAWAVPVYAFVAGYLGRMLRFPGWMDNLSPFGHVPRLPSQDLDLVPLAVLTLLAAALVAVGLAGFGRRDLDLK
ncbi:ABC transporter permease [Streptomyces sp. ODS28]|uniref:ABC transporter permease n=1 Tax=Streptomyces sp. ODS28 TaxID=3136688 RepID=UPI0031EA6A8B